MYSNQLSFREKVKTLNDAYLGISAGCVSIAAEDCTCGSLTTRDTSSNRKRPELTFSVRPYGLIHHIGYFVIILYHVSTLGLPRRFSVSGSERADAIAQEYDTVVDNPSAFE